MKTIQKYLKEREELLEAKFGSLLFTGSEHGLARMEELNSFNTTTHKGIVEIMRERIEKIPTEYPEYESNDYDKGSKDMKSRILKELNGKHF